MTTTDQKTPGPRKDRQSYYRITSTIMSNDLITNSRQKIEPVPVLRQVGGVYYVPHFWNSVYRVSAAELHQKRQTNKKLNTRIRYTSFNRRRDDDIGGGLVSKRWLECSCRQLPLLPLDAVKRCDGDKRSAANRNWVEQRHSGIEEAGTLLLKLLYEHTHTTQTVAVSFRLGDCLGIGTERAVRRVGRQGKH